MTQWLQPLDLVKCGLIKTVQRARRGRLMATHSRQWRDTRDRVVGRAVSLSHQPPPLEPWRPPDPTIAQGIFFYHKTHHEELTREKTQIAIQKAFMDACITPFKPGSWKQYVQSSFMSRAAPKACNILHQVFKLQEERAVRASTIKIPATGMMLTPCTRKPWYQYP